MKKVFWEYTNTESNGGGSFRHPTITVYLTDYSQYNWPHVRAWSTDELFSIRWQTDDAPEHGHNPLKGYAPTVEMRITYDTKMALSILRGIQDRSTFRGTVHYLRKKGIRVLTREVNGETIQVPATLRNSAELWKHAVDAGKYQSLI